MLLPRSAALAALFAYSALALDVVVPPSPLGHRQQVQQRASRHHELHHKRLDFLSDAATVLAAAAAAAADPVDDSKTSSMPKETDPTSSTSGVRSYP